MSKHEPRDLSASESVMDCPDDGSKFEQDGEDAREETEPDDRSSRSCNVCSYSISDLERDMKLEGWHRCSAKQGEDVSENEEASEDDEDVGNEEASEDDEDVKAIREVFGKSSSSFTCSSSIECGDPFEIFYKKKKGDGQDASSTLQKICLPASAADLKELVAACDVASFGMGKKDVTDESYRRAYKLDTDRFATMFEISQTGILHKVHKILAPDCEFIIAEPYKLNVYEEGGFFKVHKDTPRSRHQFGSLVLCLPQSFTGGTLKLQHKGAEKRWTPLKNVEQEFSIQWMAFYSDVDHDVEPVKSGTRITLTYNLSGKKADEIPRNCLAPIDDELFKSMARLVGGQKFKGILGFPLKFVYTRVSEAPLKGQDRIVWDTLTRVAEKFGSGAVKNRSSVVIKIEKWLAVSVMDGKERDRRRALAEKQQRRELRRLEQRRKWRRLEEIESDDSDDERDPSEEGSHEIQEEKLMFIAWDKFKDGACLCNHERTAEFYEESYKAKCMPVTWVRKPTKFEYTDKISAYCHADFASAVNCKEMNGTDVVYAAGCLLAFVA
jgi:hypothetical protein